MTTFHNKDYLSVTPKEDEDTWIRNTWRPVVAWTYIVTCSMDFVVFPILWAIYLVLAKAPIIQWDPLTLKGAGLYHLAMGAILGVSAWSRGREKIAILNHQAGIDNSTEEDQRK